MTEEVVQYNVGSIKRRMPYGTARQYVQEFMDSPYRNKQVDMRALGIKNPVSLYNSCYQAARRNFPGCRVARENGVYLILEKVGEEDRE